MVLGAANNNPRLCRGEGWTTGSLSISRPNTRCSEGTSHEYKAG